VTEITLPEAVSQDLFGQLLEPFDSEGDAKQFCKETYSTAIILDHNDSVFGVRVKTIYPGVL
jgi:hypothetical protein